MNLLERDDASTMMAGSEVDDTTSRGVMVLVVNGHPNNDTKVAQ